MAQVILGPATSLVLGGKIHHSVGVTMCRHCRRRTVSKVSSMQQ